MIYMEHWDKQIAPKLREQGLTTDQVGFCVGLLAEHRLQADREGYIRGFNDGDAFAKDKRRELWEILNREFGTN